MTGEWRENASLLVAEQVPGFDFIFMGHDHTLFNSTANDKVDSSAVILNPANNANHLAEGNVTFILDDNGKVIGKN